MTARFSSVKVNNPSSYCCCAAAVSHASMLSILDTAMLLAVSLCILLLGLLML